MVFLILFFEKVDFEKKKQQTTKNVCKLPSRQRVEHSDKIHNMATKQAMISNGDKSSMDSNNDDDKFEDVELIVEDRRIRANSGILAYHSPVFASLLRGYGGTRSEVVSEPERHIHMRYPSARYEFRSESSKAVQTRMGEPTMELVIPNYQYKDIKKALAYLVDKDGKKTMSGWYHLLSTVGGIGSESKLLSFM